MENKRGTEIPLKFVLDRNKKKVVFAEANSDFVDILFSFLTLPMGTIVRRLANHSVSDPSHQKVIIWGFSNLYGSVSDLDIMYFQTKECKEMLLNTRNSAELRCQNLKINVDDMKPIQYFICEALCFQTYVTNPDWSTSCTEKCTDCLKYMRRPLNYDANGEGGFVPKTSSFVIRDDLHATPNNPISTLGILESSGIKDFAALEENILKLGSDEILHLLECSFLSKTVLSDMFFGQKSISSQVPTIQSPIRTESANETKKIRVNVYLQKSTNKILLAHCSEEFINFLFSLLTVPLGKVISLLPKENQSLCIENMHQSVSELITGEYFKSQQLKDMLIHPKLLSQYICCSHVFPLEEYTNTQKYLKLTSNAGAYDYSLTLDGAHAYSCKPLRNRSTNSKLERGFVRRPTKFLVTDDLVVTPSSAMSCFTYLQRLTVPPSDIEEQAVDIGMNEGVHLLRACLTSTSVLSNGFKFFILKNPKQETVKKPKSERL